MTYSNAKVQGHQSVGSKDRMIEWKQMDRRTDGWMEVIALPATLMRSVINPTDKSMSLFFFQP